MKSKPPATRESKKATMDKDAIRAALTDHLTYSISKYSALATTRDWFEIAAMTARDRMVERWMETMQSYYHEDP